MLKPHAALHSHFRRTSVLFKSFINRVLLLLIANKVASTLEIYFNCEDLDLEWTCHVSIDPLTVQCWNQLSFGKCRCGTKNCLNLSFKCPQLLLFLHICGCLIPGDFRDVLFAQKSRKAKMWHIWSDAHKITHYWETHLKFKRQAILTQIRCYITFFLLLKNENIINDV